MLVVVVVVVVVVVGNVVVVDVVDVVFGLGGLWGLCFRFRLGLRGPAWGIGGSRLGLNLVFILSWTFSMALCHHGLGKSWPSRPSLALKVLFWSNLVVFWSNLGAFFCRQGWGQPFLPFLVLWWSQTEWQGIGRTASMPRGRFYSGDLLFFLPKINFISKFEIFVLCNLSVG